MWFCSSFNKISEDVANSDSQMRLFLAVLNLQQRFNGRYEMAIHVVLGHQGLPTRSQCERKHGRRVVLR